MIQAVVFDCDGVLLESVPAKTQAFMDVVAEHGQEASLFLREYHEANGGVSRMKKFEYFYEQWLHRSISPKELEELSHRFSDHCLTRVLNCPMVPGAKNCLEALNGKLPLWVASGAPQDELRMILEQRGLTHYFEHVFGSPDTKEQILRRILRTNQLTPENVLMVGDSGTDLAAAEATGCQFYGRGDFPGHPHDNDLSSLAEFILTRGQA